MSVHHFLYDIQRTIVWGYVAGCVWLCCMCLWLTEGKTSIDVRVVKDNLMLILEGETSMQHCKHCDTELPHCSRFGLVQTMVEPLRAGVATSTYKHTESKINGETAKTFSENRSIRETAYLDQYKISPLTETRRGKCKWCKSGILFCSNTYLSPWKSHWCRQAGTHIHTHTVHRRVTGVTCHSHQSPRACILHLVLLLCPYIITFTFFECMCIQTCVTFCDLVV